MIQNGFEQTCVLTSDWVQAKVFSLAATVTMAFFFFFFKKAVFSKSISYPRAFGDLDRLTQMTCMKPFLYFVVVVVPFYFSC